LGWGVNDLGQKNWPKSRPNGIPPVLGRRFWVNANRCKSVVKCVSYINKNVMFQLKQNEYATDNQGKALAIASAML